MDKVITRSQRIDRGVKVRADTIYAVSSFKELMYLFTPRLVLIVGILVLPLVAPNLYWQKVLCITGVFTLLALGLDLMINVTGLICFGGAFFVGTGGYISGMMNVTFGIPIPLAMFVGTVGGAVICTGLFLPCLPLRGIYFAMVSFIYPLVVSRIIIATGAFGGTDGIAELDMLPNIWVNQYIILGVSLICTFTLRRLINEDIGLIFKGIKDNDQAIKASGINITYYKTLALFITALMGCFAGSFLAHLYGWVGISLFALDFSIFPLAAVVVGGIGTIAGALVGTLILEPVSEMFRAFAGFRIVFYATVLILFIIFWSEGILNWARRKYEQFEIKVRV